MGQTQSTTAEVGTKVPGASFTGLAQAGNRLYAADAAQHRVDVFGTDFRQLHLPGAFEDPFLPFGFSPFNVAPLGDDIAVTYSSPVARRGGGFVDVFTQFGVLVKRLIRGGLLDQPWGVAQAPPAGFGRFGGALLIGNHGDGMINAFSPVTGQYLGTLTLAGGVPFVAPSLWGLIFGDGPAAAGTPGSAGFPSTPFFTAGASLGRDGVVGEIRATA
jgi:uncharacterized protein (TIGR03118 family)